MTPDKAEQAKEKLFEKLRKGDIDGIESIFDKICETSESIPLILASKGIEPEVADQYYTKLKKYYQKKGKHYEGLVKVVTVYQEKHRQIHFEE